MRPDIFLATIGRGSNGSNALEVTEDRAAVTAESQDNIINRVNNVSQYGPSWHYVPGIGVAGTAYAEVPGSALGDLAFSRASSKTRTNAAGVVQTIGNNVPPHDYRNADGTLSTFPRLNLEPQRTNSIRNSSMVGAVAGSPGTLPTNWSQLFGTGLTRTVVGAGTENGLPYVDVRFNGTVTTTSTAIVTEASSAIAASNGQVWSNSAYVKVVSAPTPPNSFTLISYYWNVGAYVNESNTSFTPTTTLARYSAAHTVPAGTITHTSQAIRANLTNGAAYDFTIRIAAPQMELGAYATTWVPTTTAAVTRIADDAIKTGVSSLIGQTEGTIFANIRYEVIQQTGIAISDGSSAGTNWIFIRFPNSTTDARVYISASGVVLSQVIASVFVANQTYKIALGYKSGNWALYVNGTSIASGTNTFTFNAAFDRIILSATGSPQSGGGVCTKYNEAALIKTRLTNAQLAQLTTL